jgi:hypothetical protein
VTGLQDTIKSIDQAQTNTELIEILTRLSPDGLVELGAELAAIPEEPTPPGPESRGGPAIGTPRGNRDFAREFIKKQSPSGSW